MSINEIKWVELNDNIDPRGRLTAIENPLPSFNIKRVFMVHQVQKGISRGGHAHLDTDQIIMGFGGGLKVTVSDGTITQLYSVDDQSKGLYVPRKSWIKLHSFNKQSICIVLANTIYNKDKSIRDWSSYLDYFDLPECNKP